MSFLETLVALFQSAVAKPPPDAGPDAPPPLPRILDDAGDRVSKLTSMTTGPSGKGFDTWLSEFRSIIGDAALRETLVIRVLQMKLPRIVEALALVGAIRADWRGWAPPDGVPYAFRIDWATLEAYVDPSRVGQTAFDEFAGKIRAIVDMKAAEVLLALLLTDPNALVKLEYRRRGFLTLPVSEVVACKASPSTSNGCTGQWLSSGPAGSSAGSTPSRSSMVTPKAGARSSGIAAASVPSTAAGAPVIRAVSLSTPSA